MTSLRTDINKQTNALPVTAPLVNPTYPFFRDIGSETVKVVDGADTTEWQVERGVANTEAARHGAGAALIANASPYGAGGAAQTVSRIGPFSIGHAQVLGLGGNFPILLAAVPDGALVLTCLIYVTEAFDANTSMQVDIAPSNDLTNGSDLLGGEADIAIVRSGDPDHYLLPAKRKADGMPLGVDAPAVIADSSLIAYVNGDALPTQGLAHIYALIATPA